MARYTIEDGLKKRKLPRIRAKYLSMLFIFIGAGTLLLRFPSLVPHSSGSTNSSQHENVKTSQTAQKLLLDTQVPWQGYGTAAYAIEGQGVMARSNPDDPVKPTASLAKMITALAVLKKKPLQPGEQGPSITITQNDLTSYEQYVRKDGSVVQIELGEEITEYQALQAMLHISANNMSDTLATWAFGSQEAYVAFANNMLREMNLTHTTVSDASGFSPNTTSSAGELASIGLAYVQNPVLLEIAQQKESTIPFVGVIQNYNAAINNGSQIGIKIGYTDEAGRCFVLVDLRQGKPASAVAVLGAEHLLTAMQDSQRIINAGNEAYDKALVQNP
jgi:D-alanyl-D-alanine carboxypeptidase